MSASTTGQADRSLEEQPRLAYPFLPSAIEAAILIGALAVVGAWLVGRPLFYDDAGPVMSVFTAFSLGVMVFVRLSRRYFFGWPQALSLALIGLVLGGNLSSLLMLTSVPPELLRSFPDIVLTSVMTSVGLILFCLYELLIVLRETPSSVFILDDILIHLALVPGGVSLLGHLLDNPTYLSSGVDPRVGISLLEMVFMGAFATVAVLGNPRLFLWRFLAAGWINRLIFAALFANQFLAPVLVVLVFYPPGPVTGPGLELFVMLGGVVTTLSFLLIQAFQEYRRTQV